MMRKLGFLKELKLVVFIVIGILLIICGMHERYRVHESVLFKVLKQYLLFKDWGNSFKSKYFRNHVFSDCPLSGGEVRAAISYGNRMGLLLVVNGKAGNRGYKIKGVD